MSLDQKSQHFELFYSDQVCVNEDIISHIVKYIFFPLSLELFFFFVEMLGFVSAHKAVLTSISRSNASCSQCLGIYGPQTS